MSQACSFSAMTRTRWRTVLPAVLLTVGSCGSSNTVDDTSGTQPNTSAAGVASTSTAPATVSVRVLEDALAATRRVVAGRFDLGRTTTLTTGDTVTLRYQGEFDRSSMRLGAAQTFEGSKRLLDSLAAAGAGTILDVTKFRIYTLRDDTVIYVGPSTDGGDPATWIKYDQAAIDRLSPDSAVRLGDLLVMMLDSVTFTNSATVETLARASVNGKTLDAYRTTVEGATVVAELGNSAVRNLKVTELLDRITTKVPAVAYLDGGQLVRLSLDLTPLYAELVQLSGNPTAEAALKTTKTVVSEFTLVESAAAGSIQFTVPDPSKVRVA